MVSDYETGTIRIYDDSGELIYERMGLAREVIAVIESQFLDCVATNLSGEKAEKESSPSEVLDNPMYA
ncbi:MAG: hypothetical protein JSW28_09035 [Thermoplasmata archaeon]|nr:MAG: hypothetical protein JSW28_09035 [Thermoplasmata archaeon]